MPSTSIIDVQIHLYIDDGSQYKPLIYKDFKRIGMIENEEMLYV